MPIRAEVVAAEALSTTVRGLTLELEGGPPFRWHPGQYVVVSVPDNDAARLPYSIAGGGPGAGGRPRVELAVARTTDSAPLHDATVGDRLWLEGPSGKFGTRVDEAIPHLFVGVGTGVAPLRTMVRRRAAGGELRGPTTLVAGFRDEARLLWHAEHHQLARRHPDFRYYPTLSRATPSWRGLRGYVQDHLVAAVGDSARHVQAIVCGSRVMADAVEGVLADLGVPGDHIEVQAY